MPPQPSLIAEVPSAVDAVLAVGLAKAPGDRFESAAELSRALGGALAGRSDARIEERARALLARLAWGERLEPAARAAEAPDPATVS